MSTVHGPARNRAVRQATVERPLSVVRRSAPQRPRAPFVVLVVALMAVGLVGLLLINTSMQRKAFELTSLQEQAASLQTREQALRLEVDGLSSPDRIAAEAGRLGMVPNASPAFLRLEDGEVLGHPRAALPGTNLPGLTAPPPATSTESNAPPAGDTADDAGDAHTMGEDSDNAGNGDEGSGDQGNGEEGNADRRNAERQSDDRQQDRGGERR